MEVRKISLMILMLISLTALAAQNLKVVITTGEWEPYSSEKLPNYGCATELVTAICKAAGITPEYKFYPWVRCENSVEKGEAFAAFPYAFTEERKAKYLFSDVLFFGADNFLYYKKNLKTVKEIKYNTYEDLKQYRIGIIAGSYLIPDLEKNGLKYEITQNVEQSIKKLQAGRIDFYLDDQAVSYFAVRNLFPKEISDFQILTKPFGDKTKTGLIVSKTYPNSTEILKKFNQGLAQIKKTGEYDRIMDKYKMSKK